jgi:hypothetical protein
MCEDFAPNFGDKRTDSCITTTHHITLSLSPPVFNKKQYVCHPATILLSSVTPIADETERPVILTQLR